MVTLILASLLLPGASAAQLVASNSPYVAQTTFGAMHVIGLDSYQALGRAPWRDHPDGSGINVAIVDTGIDANLPDLAGRSITWHDFAGDRSGVQHATPYDDNGHGTHVAGIVAAHGHLQLDPLAPYFLTGEIGIAPGVHLIVAKAMRWDGTGTDANIAAAIRWAVDPNGDGNLSDGADVINLSLGIGDGSNGVLPGPHQAGSATRAAIRYAVAHGVVVVASSGNDGHATVSDPASLPDVVSVGAVNGDGQVAEFSNWGARLDVLAPGILVSTYPMNLDVQDGHQDGYAGMAGTSMSAPIVTGIVALAMQEDPSLRTKSTTVDLSAKVHRVDGLLETYATPVQGNPPDRGGFGVVNADAVLTATAQGPGALDPVGAGATLLAVALVSWVLLRRVRGRRRGARKPSVRGGP